MKKRVVVLMLVLAFILTGCGQSNTAQGIPKAPQGDNCAENVAYLQDGIDRFNEAFGVFPTDVNELLETKDGKGPFVESVPACPAGNRYVIENGIVREAPPQ
ncbi:MAG: hypothetical protein SCK29_06855 [Bacillota bacterium]|nr:hypothetical protein [Bacillota bacterium]